MEGCNYARTHLFQLNEVERKTYNFYRNKEKKACTDCKSKNEVVCLINVRQTKTLEKIAKLTGIVKIGSHFLQKENYYCKRCNKSFE